MFARVTLLEIDTMRTDVDDAVELYRAEVLPALKEQSGYTGSYVLATPDGKGMLISFWATEDAADANAEHGFYADTLARYVTLFRSPPGRESYEVMVADLPAEVN